jgi:pimeloyl-ACP methyl ester carboxylesterase
MDAIAQHLSQRWRVICPDTLGRGFSQWSPVPAQEYCLAFYARQAVSLLNQMGVQQMCWLGTSMGGAIGLYAAAGALRGRIQKLVLNDIGPELASAAVQRIRSYAGSPPSFATVAELEAYFRTVYKPYGWLSDAQWRLLTESSLRRLPDGRVTPHYDPALVQQFEHHPHDYDQWPAWESLNLPVLCLRGESSDLLLPDVAQAMRERGPRARVVNVPGCGHAPALNTPEQWALVEHFLAA